MAFADFPTQQRVIDLLQKSLTRGRLGHAYLFSGDDLASLADIARTLAKTLNCSSPRRSGNGIAIDSCDQCLSCRKITQENAPDVRWVRPESKSRIITIDQIRDVMQSVYLKAAESEFKVTVICAADRLNVQAANAFLKTLEEPPARCVLILLTTEHQRMLETILSRCLRLNFAGGDLRIGADAGLEWLAAFSQLAGREHKSILARYRLLGILLQKLNEIKEAVDKALTASSPLEKHDDIEPKLREKWEDELAAAKEAEYRHRRAEVLVYLEWWLRDIWLETLAFGKQMVTFHDLAPTTDTIAKRLTPAAAMQNIAIIEQLQRLLATNVQEALALEVGLLKLQF